MLTRSPSSVRSIRARWLVAISMCVVLVGTCALYFRALDSVPVVVAVDEARFALHGHAIATRGGGALAEPPQRPFDRLGPQGSA